MKRMRMTTRLTKRAAATRASSFSTLAAAARLLLASPLLASRRSRCSPPARCCSPLRPAGDRVPTRTSCWRRSLATRPPSLTDGEFVGRNCLPIGLAGPGTVAPATGLVALASAAPLSAEIASQPETAASLAVAVAAAGLSKVGAAAPAPKRGPPNWLAARSAQLLAL